MKFPRLAVSVISAFWLVSCATTPPDEKIEPVDVDPALRGHPYANFITTLKSLCQTDKNILLGDSSHSDPAIVELTSDPVVLQTIKDCNRPFVLEAGIEQNTGYPAPKYELDPQKYTNSVETIQEALKAGGYDIDINGLWDDHTHEAFFNFIEQMQERYGWKQDPQGIYSGEFGALLRQNIPSQALIPFLDAMQYLDDTGQMPVPVTQHTLYQDIQADRVTRTGKDILDNPLFAKSPDFARIAQAEFDRVYYAAKLGLTLVYPDPRQREFLNDPEMSKLHTDLLYGRNDLATTAGEINQMVEEGAKLNKDISYRPLVMRMADILDKSLSRLYNQRIVDNMEDLTESSPTISLYGFYHMSGLDDFDEMMGQDQTVTILLQARPDQVFFVPGHEMANVEVDIRDTPNYIYRIYNDETIKIEEGGINEKEYRRMIRHSITPEEYQTAVDQLPHYLRGWALPYTEYDADMNNNVLPENWLETDMRIFLGKPVQKIEDMPEPMMMRSLRRYAPE